MGDHPRPLRFAASDKCPQIVSPAGHQGVAQFGLLQEHRIAGTSQGTSIRESTSDLDGAVAQQGARLVVEPENVVLPLTVRPLGEREGTFEAGHVL